MYHMNTKKTDVALLISVKIDLNPGALPEALYFILS